MEGYLVRVRISGPCIRSSLPFISFNFSSRFFTTSSMGIDLVYGSAIQMPTAFLYTYDLFPMLINCTLVYLNLSESLLLLNLYHPPARFHGFVLTLGAYRIEFSGLATGI